MEGQRNGEVLGADHRLETQLRIGQVDAVIRKARCACLVQGGKIRQLLALQSLGDCGSLEHIDRHLLCLVEHILQGLDLVHDRLGVRHAHHRCESAGSGSRGARKHILLVRQTGIAEVHVNVHQSGGHRPSRQIDRRTVCLQIVADVGDDTVISDQNIGFALGIRIRIEQYSMFQ